MTQRISKFWIVIICLIFACIAGVGIAGGKLKAVYMLVAFSILITVPYIIGKIGLFSLFCFLVFVYWIPIRSGLGANVSRSLIYMGPSEFCMWILCIGIFIQGAISKSAQFKSAMRRFPFLAFGLIIAGSITANLLSGSLFAKTETGQIRVLFLLPGVIYFLFLFFIETTEQAERLLWIFLISSALLGLVYLFAPNIGLESYHADLNSGRILRIIKLPLCDVLYMSPETSPICFAFVAVLSFNLWINYPSPYGRWVAFGVLLIVVFAVVKAQGRTALIAATCSVAVIQILSSLFKIRSPGSAKRPAWKLVMIVSGLLLSTWYFAQMSEIGSFRKRGLLLLNDPVHSLTVSGRIGRWTTAAYAFRDNPFGVGIWGFPGVETDQSWAAHNLYLFQLLSVGIIGFCGIILIYIRFIRAYMYGLHSNSSNRRILCNGGIGCMIVMLVGGMGSCIFWSPWQIFMGWIPIGITFAAATLPERDGSQRTEGRNRMTEIRRKWDD